jgi:hypothetical protein
MENSKEVDKTMVRRTIEDASKNLEAAVAVIPARYRAGVEKADWFTAATSDAAQKLWIEKITDPKIQERRLARLKEVTNADWIRAAVEKGATVISDRIRKAVPKYKERFGPILDAMNRAAEAAPPKSVDFRANITNRLIPVVEAAKRAAGKL